jgi:integrase
MKPGSNVVRIRLKGINTVRRYRKDGSFALYRYHRASGRQLTGEPGSPEFVESYAAAERSLRDRAKGTISALIRRFEDSPQFADMRADTTQKEYKRKFKVIERKWGSAPIAAFNDKQFRIDVLEWRDEIAKRARREADNLASALARLGAWAFDRGELDRNVLDKIIRVYHSDRADKLWLPNHVEAFLKVASPEMEKALMLAMHTGQRQGDLRRLPWTAYDGTRITLKQSKGGRTVSVRCTAALRALLDRFATEKKGLLILTTPTGRAWTKRYFNEHWNEAAKAAGITGLHFHDLRGTAVTMLAEAGCTVPEIAAVTGHSLKHVTHILEVYLSRTRHLADAAIVKLERRAKRLQRQS